MSAMRLGAPLRGGHVTAGGLHVPLVQVANPGDGEMSFRTHLLVHESDAEGYAPWDTTEQLLVPGGWEVVIGLAITGAGAVDLDGPAEVANAPPDTAWRGRVAVGPTVTNRSEAVSEITLHVTATTIAEDDIGQITSLVRASTSLAPDRGFRPTVIVQLPDAERD